MKILISAFIVMVLVLSGCGQNSKSEQNQDNGLTGKISISGAYAMYPMVVRWGEEFKKLHPSVEFDIQAGGAGKGMTDVLSGTVDFGMVSRAINSAEETKGAYAIGVTIDAVIPTFSADNPYYNTIYQKGVTRQQLHDIFLSQKIQTWGDLLGNGAKEKMEIYTRSDACGAGETFAKYLDKNAAQENLNGIGVFGDPGLAEAVRRSKFSIGYNNVNFTYDAGTRKPNEGLGVIPLDLNENNILDPEEKMYESLDTLDQAIAIGKFPSPPARILYLVHKNSPSDTLKISFLRWILTDGQKFCPEAGYIPLSPEKIDEQIHRIPEIVK